MFILEDLGNKNKHMVKKILLHKNPLFINSFVSIFHVLFHDYMWCVYVYMYKMAYIEVYMYNKINNHKWLKNTINVL